MLFQNHSRKLRNQSGSNMELETARAGIEFIYNMREHWSDVLLATVWALGVYAAVLWIKKKLDK